MLSNWLYFSKLKFKIMSLDVGYSYFINLTEEEKLEIDKQV